MMYVYSLLQLSRVYELLTIRGLKMSNIKTAFRYGINTTTFSLDDQVVVCSRYHDRELGTVDAITRKGINVRFTGRTEFIKWYNVCGKYVPGMEAYSAKGTESKNYQGFSSNDGAYLMGRGIQVKFAAGAIEDSVCKISGGDKVTSGKFTIQTLPFDYGQGNLKPYSVCSEGKAHDLSPEAKE